MSNKKDYVDINKSGIYMDIETKEILIICPNCDSTEIWKCGFAIRRDGKVQLYQCKNCGSKFRGK